MFLLLEWYAYRLYPQRLQLNGYTLKKLEHIIHRGYYTVAWRYEFYFRVAKQHFTNERSEWVKYWQKDIDKIIEGNDQNYVIDKLTCEIMENKPLGSQM